MSELYLFLKAEIRYYDPQTDSLKKLSPDRDVWAQSEVEIRNVGGDPVPKPPISQFYHFLYDDTDPFVRSLEVDWSQLRQETDITFSKPGYLGQSDTIQPGESAYLQGLTSIDTEDRVLLLWNHDSKKQYLEYEDAIFSDEAAEMYS